MRIWKAHSLGNDYLVWEGEAGFLTPQRVRKICDRHYGVGGDGILEPRFDGALTESGLPYELRIWNPDGSVAEKSGNGIRIFGYWLRHRYGRHIDDCQNRFQISTGYDQAEATVYPATVNWPLRQADWEFPPMVRVDMGLPRWAPEKIPSTVKIWETPYQIEGAQLKLWAVGMGNPHCVSFFESHIDIDALPWCQWGAALEKDTRFPNRTNVQFARVISTDCIEIRIWERGAAQTEASGSSASAVFAVARKMGWVESSAKLQMPGGTMYLKQESNGHVSNAAPVSAVGCIEMDPQFIEKIR